MKRPLIGLVICSVCFVLSIGLCGMERNSTGGSLAVTGLFLFGISILGGAVCLIWLVIALIRGPRN